MGVKKNQRWWIRAVMLAGVLFAIQLIRTSGSDQGTAGLAIIVLILGVTLTRRVSAFSITVILAAAIASIALLLFTTAFLSSLSPDVTSLSGRTFLYRAGVHEFLGNFSSVLAASTSPWDPRLTGPPTIPSSVSRPVPESSR